MNTQEQIFFNQNGYNQDVVIRQFINDFARKYPYIDVKSVPIEVIKKFVEQPEVVQAGTARKMDLLQDYLVSQDLCHISP
jgi:hypothetical protein